MDSNPIPYHDAKFDRWKLFWPNPGRPVRATLHTHLYIKAEPFEWCIYCQWPSLSLYAEPGPTVVAL